MKRALFLSVALAVAAFSADSKSPAKHQAPATDVEMSTEAHEPFFQAQASRSRRPHSTTDISNGGPTGFRSGGPTQFHRRRDLRENGTRPCPSRAPRNRPGVHPASKLDLGGRIPTAAEVREFLADQSPDKRAKLVSRLVGSPEWVDKWTYFFMDALRANGKMARGINLFHYSLKQSLAADRPYDDWVRYIIAASGKSNYVVAALNPIVREHVEGKPGEAARWRRSEQGQSTRHS